MLSKAWGGWEPSPLPTPQGHSGAGELPGPREAPPLGGGKMGGRGALAVRERVHSSPLMGVRGGFLLWGGGDAVEAAPDVRPMH